MYIVYKKENGRLVSIDLDGSENIVRDNAELFSQEQADDLAAKHDARVMSEDDWFSY